MQMFIDFIGDRPIIAHNAHFDVGFMTAAANRQGLKFSGVPRYARAVAGAAA